MNEAEIVSVSKVPVIAGLSIVTVKLIEAMKDKKPGDIYDDAALKSISGRDCSCTGDGYPSLRSAIRHVRRNHGLVWERVIKSGFIKCLKPPETLSSVGRDGRRIHRIAGVQISKLKAVDPNQLEGEKRTEYFARLAQSGTLRQFSGASTVKALERNVGQTVEDAQKLQKKMLEAFR